MCRKLWSRISRWGGDDLHVDPLERLARPAWFIVSGGCCASRPLLRPDPDAAQRNPGQMGEQFRSTKERNGGTDSIFQHEPQAAFPVYKDVTEFEDCCTRSVPKIPTGSIK
jgi:hypothetical protein